VLLDVSPAKLLQPLRSHGLTLPVSSVATTAVGRILLVEHPLELKEGNGALLKLIFFINTYFTMQDLNREISLKKSACLVGDR
jgi:hypothetical protein